MKSTYRPVWAAAFLFACGGTESTESEELTVVEVTAESLQKLPDGAKLTYDFRAADKMVVFDPSQGSIDFSRVELMFVDGPQRVPDWLQNFDGPINPYQNGFVVSGRPTRGPYPEGCHVCKFRTPAWVCWDQCFEDTEPTLRNLEGPPQRDHENELPEGPTPDPEPRPGPEGGGGSGPATGGGGSTGGGSTGGGSSGSGSGGSSAGGGTSSGGLGGGGPSTPGPGL
ncbi:MAG: hypothetical protein RIT81_20450 [Deltaproteobacteria bacterium]